MNNYNFTQALDGLNNIEADTINTSNLNVGSLVVDTAEITTLSDCNLLNCTAETPLNPTSVANKTYVDTNFMFKTGSVVESITGSKTFSNSATFSVNATVNTALFCNTLSARNPGVNTPRTLFTNLTTASTITIGTNNTPITINSTSVSVNGDTTFTNNLISNSQATFNNICPISNTNATLTNHLTTLGFNNGKYIDFTTDQTITGTKRFDTIFTGDHSWRDVGSPFSNRVQSYISGNNLGFVPQFANNTYTFYCKDAVPTQTSPLTISSASTTIANNLISNSQATFNTICPISNTNATLTNHLTTLGFNNGKYIDFLTDQTITGTKQFNSVFCTSLNITPISGGGGNRQQVYITGDYLAFVPQFNNNNYAFQCRDGVPNLTTPLNINYLNTTIANNLISNSQATFNTICPISNTNATLTNHLTTLGFNNGKYIDFLSNQSITGEKTFGTIFGGTYNFINALGKRVAIGLDNNSFQFVPVSNSNLYRFYVKDAVGNQITSIYSDYANTIIGNNLTSNGEATFNTWVNLKFRTRIYDVSSPNTNYTQMYMIGNNEFVIGPNSNGDFISFYCKDATLGQLQTFKSSALGNTSLVNLTCSASLITNNLTSPSTTGTNNIYTNLDTTSGGGIINIGAIKNNINIKCSLNIVESVYGTTPTKITTINQEGDSCRFTNNGSSNGDFIFEINESGTYNPLIINKTSVDIAGDALVFGDLILYDTTPSTKNVIIGMVGNDLFFTPSFNTSSSSYNFKVADSGSTITTPLIINSTNTTIANNLISNGEATFNTWVNLKFRTRIYDVSSPNTNYTNMYMIGGNEFVIGPNSNGDFISFYCKDATLGTLQTFKSSALGNTSLVPFLASSTSIFNGQATFNNVAPISNTAPTLPAHLTTRAYVDSVSGSSILSLNNTFTGFNTYTNGLTIRNTLLIKDSTNVQESSINLTGGLLGIGCSVNNGKILLQTFDSTGAAYTRLTADANEINITAPLTLFIDYTYYNPFNFSSTRLGYSMSNTGSTNTLTNNTPNNSGQINIPAGSWNITYTGTITVITGTLTTLTSLEIYVADSLTNDLNIIGINVINYYQLSSVPVGKKMRISGSGTYISYINTSTELNLRLLPLFTGGSGGLNFQGKISATRNA